MTGMFSFESLDFSVLLTGRVVLGASQACRELVD